MTCQLQPAAARHNQFNSSSSLTNNNGLALNLQRSLSVFNRQKVSYLRLMEKPGKGCPVQRCCCRTSLSTAAAADFFSMMFWLLIPYPIPAAHLISDSSLYDLKNINLIVDSKAITLRGNIRLPILQNKNNNKKSLIINLMRSASPFHFKIVVWPRYN